MRITVRELRALLQREARIAASPEYMKKEKVRQELQDHITAVVASGKVADQRQLEKFMQFIAEERPSPDTDLALTALKMIPFAVWKKMASSAQ